MDYKLNLSSTQIKELKRFCELNSIQPETLIKSAYDKGIKIEMYGLLGVENNFHDNSEIERISQEFSTKIQEMENIFQNEKKELLERIEKLGEGKVVEKIIEVEKIVEKPVEVIKEVIVEKEITDTNKLKNLEQTLQKLKLENIEKEKKIKELETTISELKNNIETKAVFLRGSNLKDKQF